MGSRQIDESSEMRVVFAVVEPVKAPLKASTGLLKGFESAASSGSVARGSTPSDACAKEHAAKGSGQGKPVHDAGHGNSIPPRNSVTCCLSLSVILAYLLQSFCRAL